MTLDFWKNSFYSSYTPTMIDAYTINVAWLMHQESSVGSIEAGKKADIAVLESNLFEIPATRLSDVQVLLTLLDGEPVYVAGMD